MPSEDSLEIGVLPNLYLFTDDPDHGLLVITADDGRDFAVALTPTWTRILLLHIETWERDKQEKVPAEQSGYRKAERIAQLLKDRFDHFGPTKNSVHRAWYRMLRTIREQAKAQLGDITFTPPIFRKKFFGARLNTPGIHVHRDRSPKELSE